MNFCANVMGSKQKMNKCGKQKQGWSVCLLKWEKKVTGPALQGEFHEGGQSGA